MTGRELRKKHISVPVGVLLIGYMYLIFSVLSIQWALGLNLALFAGFAMALLFVQRRRR